MQNVLFLLHGIFLLAFGVVLSAAFSGIHYSHRNLLIMLGFCAFSGLLQTVTRILWDEAQVWMIYPLVTHLPLVLLLWLIYRKRLLTSLMAVFTAYLCCQPGMWLGLIVLELTQSEIIQYIVNWVVLAAVAVVVLRYVAAFLAQILNKDNRSVLIFGIIPAAYYVFDYSMAVYTSLWLQNNRIVLEFLPFLLCATFFLFCMVYYKEYEQKADAQRKEQLVRFSVEQQAKEVETIKRSEQEIRMLRHDMRMILSTIGRSVAENDHEAALKLVHNYTEKVDATALRRYCGNTIVNYVLCDYAARFEKAGIAYEYVVEVENMRVDETLFCSLLSNGLDNALNAQQNVTPDQRKISLLLKNTNGKLLLSIRNPVGEVPVFVDGMPVSGKKGHGYGTQSIRYIAERLGGKCQFLVEDKTFVLRVII